MGVDVAIVGAQKAGTTSLKEYLAQHPSIHTHPQIEFSYFRDDDLYNRGYVAAEKEFLTVNNGSPSSITLIKNVGIYSSEIAVQRLYEHNPNCHIVFLVRNPVLRAFSSFSMEKFNGWYKEDFEKVKQVIEEENYSDVSFRLFIGHGLYVNHLKLLYRFFKKEQIKIVEYESFVHDRAAVCKSILKWIGLDENFEFNVNKVFNETKKSNSAIISSILIQLRSNKNPLKKTTKFILPYSWFTKLGGYLISLNKSKKRSKPMSQDMNDYLKAYFAHYNQEFDRLAGTNFSDEWNKL